jgi:tetraacyldisaccharide 4'-kinase
MRLATPQGWYQRRSPWRLRRALLEPASWVWARVTADRIARSHPYDPEIPVICVGNLTLGGTGKTPVVRALAAKLVGNGFAVHILCRGHGGRLAGPLRIDPQVHSAADVGDEALMMSADAPVWASKDRALGAATARAAGAEVILMDDGHQNPTVKKSLSLVVVDAETRDGEWPFGDGAVFPAGPMREPFAVGLRRADAVVLLLPADLEAADPELLALVAGKPVLIARLCPARAPPRGPQLGFAGIGKPWKMERALKAAGCDLVDFAPLPDHARYDERLLRFLARRAERLGAGLVTTEKDWVKLPAEWRAQVSVWPVEARFEDEAALDAILEPKLRR